MPLRITGGGRVVEATAFARESVYGQVVEVAVVLSSADPHSEKKLMDLCVSEVGGFKGPQRAPQRVYFMNALPKGPSGKVQRLKLSEMFQKGDARDTTTLLPD